MPFKVPDEVGDRYDIGLETRDGSTLACKDRKGNTLNLSQVGYVTSTKQTQSEATELQHKAQLVQLGPTAMDREWDQWVQESQGSWASGLGQRIQFGGQSDPAGYWDGLGIIWPTTDWLPQQPFQPPAYKDALQPSPGVPDFMGVVAGNLNGVGVGYAQVFKVGAVPNVVFLAGTPPSRQTMANPIGGNASVQDMAMGHGNIWVVGSDAGGQLSLFYIRAGLVVVKLATITAATAVARPAMACGNVTNRQYVAVVATLTPVANFPQDQITVYDVTSVAATPTNNASTQLNLPTGWVCNQTAFLGDDLVVSMSDGMNTEIAAWNIASQSWRTLAQMPGATDAHMVPVAGGMLVLVNNAISSTQKAIDIYILQGTALQHYGPLVPQIGPTIFPYVAAVSKPAAFGPYGIFAVVVQAATGGACTLLIYAYDVLRGRIFKVASTPGFDSTYAALIDSQSIAAFASMQRTSPTTLNAQWGIAININQPVANANNIQEYLVGIQKVPGSAGALLQLPSDLTSGLIDFTSAQPKLLRQLLARFTKLPATASSGVTLNAWIDQDPGVLAAAPDFTAVVTGGAAGGPNGTNGAGLAKLSLPLNQMAIKLVYEVVSAGGVWTGAAWVDAPRIISVAVQAATGWVWHMYLACTRGALTNANVPEDYVFDRQKIDEVAAYNFIKQLWRLKGGECKATYANGDSYLALLQMVDSQGPKPFATSFLGNVPDDRYEGIVEVRIREDI